MSNRLTGSKRTGENAHALKRVFSASIHRLSESHVMPFDVTLQSELVALESAQLLRRLRRIDSACGPVVTMAGRPVILMASNDYLGLANHPNVKQAAIETIQTYGVGAGAARLVSGTQPPHEALEAALAAFKGMEAALCFGSGYLANLGLITTLAKPGDLILADRLCHASLVDGCRLSRAQFRVYHHADAGHLERLLHRRSRARRTLIVTDGLFSMDGDLAPLKDLVALAARFDALLVVDDAHGTGILGPNGRGSLEACDVEAHVPFHMGTLGKALGTSGAYVVGSRELIGMLVNQARSFLFTTASPAALSAATLAALDLARHDQGRRAALWNNRERLFTGLTRLGFRLTATVSPILPVLVGDPAKAVVFAKALLSEGVYAPAIRPPTVPRGSSRIRFTVTAAHTPEHVDQVLAACERAGRALSLI